MKMCGKLRVEVISDSHAKITGSIHWQPGLKNKNITSVNVCNRMAKLSHSESNQHPTGHFLL